MVPSSPRPLSRPRYSWHASSSPCPSSLRRLSSRPPPVLARPAASPSAALLRPPFSFTSSYVCPAGSGARRWRTAPDTNRTRSYGPPPDSRTAWSCTTTVARVRIRRRRQDPSVCPVPWWLPPAPSPRSSPFPPPRALPRRAQVFPRHLRLCVPLFLEGHTVTSLPCNTVWKDVQDLYLRAVFLRNF